MSTYTLERTEIVPHLDENWVIMQMKSFQFTAKIEWEKWDTLEQIEKELDEAFENQRKSTSKLVPSLVLKDKQIAFLLNEIKKISPNELKSIIAKAKQIK